MNQLQAFWRALGEDQRGAPQLQLDLPQATLNVGAVDAQTLGTRPRSLVSLSSAAAAGQNGRVTFGASGQPGASGGCLIRHLKLRPAGLWVMAYHSGLTGLLGGGLAIGTTRYEVLAGVARDPATGANGATGLIGSTGYAFPLGAATVSFYYDTTDGWLPLDATLLPGTALDLYFATAPNTEVWATALGEPIPYRLPL